MKENLVKLMQEKIYPIMKSTNSPMLCLMVNSQILNCQRF